MGTWLYLVVMMNAKMVSFIADEVEEEEGTYKFYLDGEVIGQFKKDNIAGYFMEMLEDLEDD